MLWIEVLIPTFKLLVCVVYRPTGTTASFWDNFDYSLAGHITPVHNSDMYLAIHCTDDF